jgi:stage III sporulation protein AH
MYADETTTALQPKTQITKSEKVKNFFSKFGKRNVIIASALLLVGVAVCLNLVLSGNSQKTNEGFDGYGETSGNDQSTENAPTNEDTQTNTTEQYFSSVAVSRQKARDEALEVLASVVENEDANETVKNDALASIAALAKEMQYESDIESLIVAKGFEDCIAIINGDTASIVVKCPDALLPAQIAQINEIVYSQASIVPANITIIHRT